SAIGRSKKRRVTSNTSSTKLCAIPWFFTYMKPAFDSAQRICFATACLSELSSKGATSFTGIASKFPRVCRSVSPRRSVRSSLMPMLFLGVILDARTLSPLVPGGFGSGQKVDEVRPSVTHVFHRSLAAGDEVEERHVDGLVQ